LDCLKWFLQWERDALFGGPVKGSISVFGARGGCTIRKERDNYDNSIAITRTTVSHQHSPGYCPCLLLYTCLLNLPASYLPSPGINGYNSCKVPPDRPEKTPRVPCGRVIKDNRSDRNFQSLKDRFTSERLKEE